MSETKIDFILTARRASGREEFHKLLFESMLGGRWRQQVVALSPAEAVSLRELLARWIREAPVKDELGVVRMLAVRGVIRNLVMATGEPYRQFLQEVLAASETDLRQPQIMPGWKQLKLAALADGSVLPVEALADWSAHDPALARLAAIASLDACPRDAETARSTGAIGRWLISIPPVPLPAPYLAQCQTSAFFVSYLADPERHAFKRAIARQAAFLLQGLPLPAARPAARGAGPARLTIVGELLFPQHAMFRCYAHLMAGLKEHFHVTLVADMPTRCPEHARFSHEQRYFPPHERDVGRLAQLVASTAPDIVFYPSVGMSYWTFTLSLLRLAPLQLMSVGHPAPSCSPHIDGTLVYGELATSPLPEYGPLVSYDHQALPAPPPQGWQVPPRQPDTVGGIAINAAHIKLTPDFLALLDSALAAAPADTPLHFFPNAAGAELLALRRDLQQRFPTAQVHAATDYAHYMALLAQSAVVLQSFPFGGTNTAMDALALGIPLVCLEDGDLAARVDPLLLRRAGLGELCTASPAEYLALVQRLLNEPAARARILTQARAGFATLREQDSDGQHTMAEAILNRWQAQAAA